MSPQKRRNNLRRAAELERETARVLKTERIHRERGVTAGDTRTVFVGDYRLQPECKRRKRIPALIASALDQARGYDPGAIPIAVVRADGDEAVVCLRLDHFALLVGIDPASLPTRHRPTPRSARQCELFGGANG